MLTRERYLFFLTNSSGQCYYVDTNGSVQTCQPSDPRSWLPQAPEGWFEQQIGFGRNMKYWGMNRSYSPPLKFVNDGAKIIRYLFYTQQGIETPLYLAIAKYNIETDIYDPYYKGEIDMSQIDDSVVESVAVNVMQGGLQKILKAYENTVFEIPVDGSIPENIVVKINGILFNATFNYAVVPVNTTSKGTIVPMVFQNQQGNDIGIIKNDQTIQGFDPFNDPDFDELITNSSNYLLSSVRALENVKLQFPITFNGNLTNGCLVAFTSKGNAYPLVNNIALPSRIPSGAIVAGQVYNVNTTIGTLDAGENLFIMLITNDNTPSLTFDTGTISIEFNSQFEDTETYCIKPYDLLNILVKKITDKAFPFPDQRTYEVQSNLLKQNANFILTSGSALRNESGAVIKTSLAEFFDSFDAEFMCCMGTVVTNSFPGEALFFESLNYVFNSGATPINIGEVSKLKIKPATDLFFDTIKIGYPEQKYDEKQGNNEYNTTAQYKAPIKRVNKEYSKISKYRADSYGVEYTRFLINTSNSTNNKSDNNTFILNIDYNNIIQAKSTANGVLGFYYGTGATQGFPETNNGNNRNLLMAYTPPIQPQGDPLSNLLEITNFPTQNSTIRYNGANQTLQMILNARITYIEDLSYKITFSKSVLENGFFVTKYNVRENLQGDITATLFFTRNNVNIFAENILIHPGQNQTFTISHTFKDWPFKTGDEFNCKIEYTSRTQYDVTLITFDINDYTVSFSSDLSEPIYGLLKVDYDNSNLVNWQQAYNIEGLTPVRLLQKHAPFIKSILFNQPSKSLSFQTADKNKSLNTTLNGITTSDGADVPINTLQSNTLFYPFYFEIETKIDQTFLQLFNQSANALIEFTFNGKTFQGFPVDLKVKPTLQDSQQWKLLCSPNVNLNDLIDLSYNGFNNLDLMQYGLAVPMLCPVKFVPLGYMKPAQYNFIHIDEDWFIKQVGFWPFKDDYYQKWQKNDTIELQVLTNGLGPVNIQVIDCKNNEVATFSLAQKIDPSIVNPNILWEGSYALNGLDEGIYYMIITAGSEDTTAVMISEPLYVKEIHKRTLLFEYKSTRNTQAVVFNTGYQPSFRVEAWIDNYKPKARFTTYEDQPANIELLDAIPMMTATLNIGDDRGVPPWVIRLMDRIMLLNNVTIEGVGFTRDGQVEWEQVTVPGFPKSWWKLQIRESKNRNAITLTAEGELNDKLTVAYNINSDAFGDGSNGGNVIQVIKTQ